MLFPDCNGFPVQAREPESAESDVGEGFAVWDGSAKSHSLGYSVEKVLPVLALQMCRI